MLLYTYGGENMTIGTIMVEDMFIVYTTISFGV